MKAQKSRQIKRNHYFFVVFFYVKYKEKTILFLNHAKDGIK